MSIVYIRPGGGGFGNWVQLCSLTHIHPPAHLLSPVLFPDGYTMVILFTGFLYIKNPVNNYESYRGGGCEIGTIVYISLSLLTFSLMLNV